MRYPSVRAELSEVLRHARAERPGLLRIDREEAHPMPVRRHLDHGDPHPLGRDERADDTPPELDDRDLRPVGRRPRHTSRLV